MPNNRGNRDAGTSEPAPAGAASHSVPDEVLAALHLERILSGRDEDASDADQGSSDADQVSSADDHVAAARDQASSDSDQAAADADYAGEDDHTPAQEQQLQRSRRARDDASADRSRQGVERGRTAGNRLREATVRDRTADARDDVAEARDDHADKLLLAAQSRESALLAQLQELRALAGAERARAAKERGRAAAERARFIGERARLEAELKVAHSDDLTGAYRREAGRTALAAEIDRARRADGRFVIAFVDVDRLKEVNDRRGHAAGDQVLETVVQTLRAKLRSYDPIVRYGGDEFVCGLGGMDLPGAEARFEAIGAAVQAAAGVGVSVGVAALGEDDTADDVIHRADLAMLEVKARRRSRRGKTRTPPKHAATVTRPHASVRPLRQQG